MNTRTAGSVVYIDLSQDSDAIWENLARSNRKKIKKCLKNNVEVSFSKDPEDVRIFSQLYSRLMEERNAKGFYKFSLDFFDNLSLNLHDRMELLLAYYDNTVIAGLLLLGHKQYIHTFLSASIPEYRDLGANNLLKYKGALRAKEMGYRYYLLGGGYGDTGGLLDFKKTFSSTTRDFRVYYKVWDEQTYHRLSEKNDSYNLQMGFHKNKDDFFFPEYRR
jgi:lipid II:glycine glycyltransferase (peptidoglycan interpeptide bridge formation enzyme)